MEIKFRLVALLFPCILLLNGIQPETPKAAKPNVIFILTDQWRAEAVGYAGNKDVITPNIDKLAGQSVVFRNAVSTIPVCTPYRGSLLTGQ